MSKVSVVLEELLDSDEAREWVSRWLKQQVQTNQSASADEDGAGSVGNN